jgi:Holliday junction resolvase
MTPARRTDANQTQIVRALRAYGFSVEILAGLGNGVPDLLVGGGGTTWLFEVKNLDGRGVRMTPAEVRFHTTWRGQVAVITDIQQAIEVIRKGIPGTPQLGGTVSFPVNW